MKKLTLFTFLTLMVCTAVHAQDTHIVNVDDALKSAVGFLPLRRDGENKAPELAHVEKNALNDHPYYYIFNRGNEQGFIIVSACLFQRGSFRHRGTGSRDEGLVGRLHGSPERFGNDT